MEAIESRGIKIDSSYLGSSRVSKSTQRLVTPATWGFGLEDVSAAHRHGALLGGSLWPRAQPAWPFTAAPAWPMAWMAPPSPWTRPSTTSRLGCLKRSLGGRGRASMAVCSLPQPGKSTSCAPRMGMYDYIDPRTLLLTSEDLKKSQEPPSRPMTAACRRSSSSIRPPGRSRQATMA